MTINPNVQDRPYETLLELIAVKGKPKSDRTGTGTISSFGHQMRFDMTDGFPLISSKRVPFRLIAAELLWFLSGDTNIKALTDQNVHIWDEWADENGELGPVYGSQWRNWGLDLFAGDRGFDQIKALVNGIIKDPMGRRHVVTAWNPSDLDEMALPPCHMFFQCYVSEDRELSLQVYQRSADMFLGVPFNIASYALLLHMIAAQTGMTPGTLVWTGGDCHIYDNHREQVELQLERNPWYFALPKLTLNPDVQSIFDYRLEDFTLDDYECFDAIPAPVAV